MIDLDAKARLLKGAGYLGKLWQGNVRCQSGFKLACACEPKTKFCEAKALWLKLAGEDSRVVGGSEDEFAVVNLMTLPEREATGLTVTVDYPGVGPVRVGPSGDIPWKLHGAMDPDSVKSVLMILKTFAGSKVVG